MVPFWQIVLIRSSACDCFFKQWLNDPGRGLGDYPVDLLAIFKHDKRGASSDFQIFGDLIISVRIPVNSENGHNLVLLVSVDQCTHGALLNSAGTSPGCCEIQHERLTTLEGFLISLFGEFHLTAATGPNGRSGKS